MPGKINLAALFKMKPRLAAEYLKNKVSQTSWNWYEIYEKEHDKVFTVAKTAGYDVLKDIRAAVQKAIDEGQSLNSFKKELKPILTQKGWWGKVPDPSDPTKEVQLGSVRRLEKIYTTNLRTSYQAGRYANLEDNAAFRPYWQYIAVMDDRTRKEHKELHGKVFRHDDPFWENFFPPNGWNCRCTVKSLSQKDLDRLGLTVESSAGKLRDATAELPNGTKVQGKVYRTNGKIIQTDVGWNYNPGRSTYQPHDDGKDPELLKALKNSLNDPLGIKASTPSNAFNVLQAKIEKENIDFNKVSPLKQRLSEEQIINKIAIKDEGIGSCSSLALAYAGNKIGLNVTDNRGGSSLIFFGSDPNIARISKLAGGVVIHGNEFKAVKSLMKMLIPGKEYYLSTGKHSAIVRKTKDTVQFLELQEGANSGFVDLNDDALLYRFKCKAHGGNGTVLFSIEKLRNNTEFKTLLGYLNTVKE